MACNCGAGKKTAKTWTHTSPSGKKTSYSTQVEAEAAAQRDGGTARPNL